MPFLVMSERWTSERWTSERWTSERWTSEHWMPERSQASVDTICSSSITPGTDGSEHELLRVSTICLHDNTKCDQISQAFSLFSLCVCVLQAIKDWKWPRNMATLQVLHANIHLPVKISSF